MSYSINLLWVNLNPQDREANRAENIFGDGLSSNKQDEFIAATKKWRALNPNTPCYLWFDSALVTQTALEKTKAVFDEIDVKLRDVRTLPNLQGELLCAMHPGIPVYFRVDVLKEVIGSYLAEKESKYVVYTDLDVEPMDSASLFDEETKSHLEKHSYVYNKQGLRGIENSFFIFKSSEFLQTHKSKFLKIVSDRIKKLRVQAGPGIPSQYLLTSHAVFDDLVKFLEAQESTPESKPRKWVACPPSQFDFGGDFGKKDHRAEQASFHGRATFPYSHYGRGGPFREIPLLKEWKPKPL